MPKTLFRASGLALAMLLASATAGAATQLFKLQGLADDGPLAGQAFSGSFAYDSAVAGPGFSGDLLLSRFHLLFAGQTYSLASADTAPAAVFADGIFLGLAYSDVDSADAALRPRLSLQPGFFGFAGEAFLAYEGAGDAAGFGSYSISAVPEPGQWALLLAGVAGLVALGRRRGKQPG